MQIGSYVDGRPLNYDEASQQFDIGGAIVSAQDIRQYDQASQIGWATEDLRSWVYQVADHTGAPGAQSPQASGHPHPRCQQCGTIAPWKVDHVFRPMDWVIGLLFTLLAGTGLIYLAVVGLIRMNPNRRDKICSHCGARNLFTFQY